MKAESSWKKRLPEERGGLSRKKKSNPEAFRRFQTNPEENPPVEENGIPACCRAGEILSETGSVGRLTHSGPTPASYPKLTRNSRLSSL
jgi:hypothetical protein